MSAYVFYIPNGLLINLALYDLQDVMVGRLAPEFIINHVYAARVTRGHSIRSNSKITSTDFKFD